MSRARIPVIPTIIVVAAVLVMIGLGIWQFQRRAEKAQALQLAASNPARPPVAFPQLPPVSPEILFRPSSVQCLRVVGWQVEAGRAADGSTIITLMGAAVPMLLLSPFAIGAAVPDWPTQRARRSCAAWPHRRCP